MFQNYSNSLWSFGLVICTLLASVLDDKSKRLKVTRYGISLIQTRCSHDTCMVLTHHHQFLFQPAKRRKIFYGVSQVAFCEVRGVLSWEDCQDRATWSEMDVYTVAFLDSNRWITAAGSMPEPYSEGKKTPCLVLELHMQLSLPVKSIDMDCS